MAWDVFDALFGRQCECAFSWFHILHSSIASKNRMLSIVLVCWCNMWECVGAGLWGERMKYAYLLIVVAIAIKATLRLCAGKNWCSNGRTCVCVGGLCSRAMTMRTKHFLCAHYIRCTLSSRCHHRRQRVLDISDIRLQLSHFDDIIEVMRNRLLFIVLSVCVCANDSHEKIVCVICEHSETESRS